MLFRLWRPLRRPTNTPGRQSPYLWPVALLGFVALGGVFLLEGFWVLLLLVLWALALWRVME